MHLSAGSEGDVFRSLSRNVDGFRSASFARALGQLQRFARDDTAPLLVEGESGTGKTALARYLHSVSPRAARPFQHAQLSAIEDSLAASELFGHVVGAYTDAKQSRSGLFVAAHGGTLFLDEVAKASRNVQQKLLHVIEYGELRPVGSDRTVKVDVRLIMATNVALEPAVERGEFLPDLYARISGFRTRLPALRERRADIGMLVASAIQRHAHATGYCGELPEVHPELMDALERAPWPYNLRQLDSTVHRLLLEAEGAEEVLLEHCRDDLTYLQEIAGGGTLTTERVAAAVAKAGSVSGAARLLGVDRTTVHRHRKRAAGG